MKFNYQARTREGQLRVGQVEALSYEAALDILQKYGYFITFLEEVRKKPLLVREVRFLQRISQRDLVLFTRQLSILLLSQTPPVEALHTLASQAHNNEFKDKILKIASEVEGGAPFSKALARYPRHFSGFYVNMIKSGEASGNLPDTLNTLADHLEREYDLLAKIKGASIYPAFVLSVMVLILVLMLFFVFPQLEKVFEETGKDLPGVTVAMLNLAFFLRQWGLVFLLVLLGGLTFLAYYIRTVEGRRVFDATILQLPLIANFLRKIYLARLSQNLSTLIVGGVPIAQALEISGKVVGNSVYRKVIFLARDGVRRGESISSILKRYPKVIPPLVSQMIFVGERTGQLDKVLARITIFYKKEVDLAIDKFISLLEPLLIVFLGIVVTIIILTILLPIYQIGLT